MKRSKQDLIDIVITACEGGVNYWADVRDYDPDKGFARLEEYDEQGITIKEHKLTTSTVRKGLALALQSEYEGIRKIAVIDILDAEQADIIVQLGLFSEIVYG